jgi:hypothetical protein
MEITKRTVTDDEMLRFWGPSDPSLYEVTDWVLAGDVPKRFAIRFQDIGNPRHEVIVHPCPKTGFLDMIQATSFVGGEPIADIRYESLDQCLAARHDDTMIDAEYFSVTEIMGA